MYPDGAGSGVGTGESLAMSVRASGPTEAQDRTPASRSSQLDASFPTPTPEPSSYRGGESQGEKLRLSWSKLSAFSDCGEKYRLRFVENVPTIKSGAGMAGQAVHEVIDLMLREGWFIDPAAVEHDGTLLFIERFNAKLDEAGGPDNVRWGGRKRNMKDDSGRDVKGPDGKPIKVGEDYAWMCQQAPTWLKRAGTILRDDVEVRGYEITDVFSEMRVSCWLDEVGGTLVTGYIDHLFLMTDDSGTSKIRDWKTGMWTDQMQLVNYAWMLKKGLNLDVGVGEFAKLRGKTRADWLVQFDLDHLVPVVERMYADSVKGLEAEHYQLKPSSFCASCDVKASCLYGRTLPED